MQTIKQQIPNLFTLGNLLCGCLAIKFAFEWDLVMATYLVGLGAVLDFFDGFLARILNVAGEMGKQLDSLADMVTFGVVPGVVMFQMMRLATFAGTQISFNLEKNTFLNLPLEISHYTIYLGFLIPLMSAYRLAKFNLDTRQTTSFIGLPTPANAIFICSLPLVLIWWDEGYTFFEIIKTYLTGVNGYSPLLPSYIYLRVDTNSLTIFHIILTNFSLIIITLLFSFLLISNLPLFALKFKKFGWKENQIRYIFLGISAAMLIIFQVLAIPFIILLYLLMSVINNFTLKQ